MTRNRRLLFLVAILVLAGAAVGTAIGLSGGSSPSGATTSAAAPASSTFAGVPQHGSVLGNASAPATLVVFEDPQCPYCRMWSLNALPTVVDRFVRTGEVKLDWQGVEIIGPNSQVGIRAAYAAARQNKLWNVVDALYRRQGSENSGWITGAVVADAAAAAGADPQAVRAATGLASVTAELARAQAKFDSFGTGGTPTFVLEQGVRNPVQVNGGLDGAGFSAALAAALG